MEFYEQKWTDVNVCVSVVYRRGAFCDVHEGFQGGSLGYAVCIDVSRQEPWLCGDVGCTSTSSVTRACAVGWRPQRGHIYIGGCVSIISAGASFCRGIKCSKAKSVTARTYLFWSDVRWGCVVLDVHGCFKARALILLRRRLEPTPLVLRGFFDPRGVTYI